MVIFAVVWLVSIGSIVSIVSISMQPGGVITSISRSNRNVAVFMVFFSILLIIKQLMFLTGYYTWISVSSEKKTLSLPENVGIAYQYFKC